MQLQHRVVERALVGERRLDVPAHQPAQERLERAALADDRPLGGDRPEPLGLVADAEPHLGGRHIRRPRPGGPHLFLQPGEEGSNVRCLFRHPAEV